jgi:putative tricarboxylic transport membrane protein
MITRRNLLLNTIALSAAAAGSPLLMGGSAQAQSLSAVDIFIPAGPGGGWDQTGRVMDKALRDAGLISSSRITNVGGAGGTVGLPQFVNRYKGKPNALFISGAIMVGAIIANKSPVDLSAVTPLARLTGEYEVLVVPAASPHKDLKSFIDAFKADPKSISWAGGATGGTDHIFACLIAKAAGVPLNQLSYVAFTAGGGEAMASLLGNQVSCGISGWAEFAEQIAAGKLRALGISAPERVPGIDAPTLKEQGVDVELSNWRGVFGAGGIKPEEQQALIDMVTKMANSESWKQEVKTRGWFDLFLPGDAFATYIAEDTKRIRGVLQEIGLA